MYDPTILNTGSTSSTNSTDTAITDTTNSDSSLSTVIINVGKKQNNTNSTIDDGLGEVENN